MLIAYQKSKVDLLRFSFWILYLIAVFLNLLLLKVNLNDYFYCSWNDFYYNFNHLIHESYSLFGDVTELTLLQTHLWNSIWLILFWLLFFTGQWTRLFVISCLVCFQLFFYGIFAFYLIDCFSCFKIGPIEIYKNLTMHEKHLIFDAIAKPICEHYYLDFCPSRSFKHLRRFRCYVDPFISIKRLDDFIDYSIYVNFQYALRNYVSIFKVLNDIMDLIYIPFIILYPLFTLWRIYNVFRAFGGHERVVPEWILRGPDIRP